MDKRNSQSDGKLILKNKGIKDSDNLFEELGKYEGIRELDLSDNLLTRLPSDLSLFESLVSLDITNNPLQNYEHVAQSLATLPNLTNLKINLSNPNEAITILTNLPNLIYLNGKTTKEEATTTVDIDETEIENFSLNNEISNFDNIFNRINEKLKPYGHSAISGFFDDFQKILQGEITKINNLVENTIPNYLYAADVLKSKMKIYSFFHLKLLSLMERKDNETVGVLRDTMNFMLDSHSSMFDLILKLSPKIEEKINMYKTQCEEAQSKGKDDSSEIQELERKLLNCMNEKDFIISQANEERQILIDKVERLERENKVMTEKLLQKARSIGTEENTNVNVNVTTNQSKIGQVLNRSGVLFGENSLISSRSNNFNNLTKSGNVMVTPVVGARVMTKKMLLEIIDEIYLSKEAFDKKCEESKMPKETMEQHMYTYLNQKYGLKNLIIEWATSIINGIRMFAPEDSEICLFGKILRNEVEEESRIVIKKLKSTIFELLTYFLKAKNPLKTNSDIQEMAFMRQNGFLNEDEWKNITYYTFEKEDAQLVETKINEFIKKKYFSNLPDSGNKKLTRQELQNLNKSKEDFKITYNDFVKIMLDYQIKLRDKYLRNFYYVFKKVDSDNNGIINEEEFINLLAVTDVYPQKNFQEIADRLLNEIDPYNNKQITFSECVTLFSKETFYEYDQNGEKIKINLLDKLALNENES